MFQTFSLENFKFEVDISVSNKQRSSMARGDFRLFILRDNPVRTSSEFSHGLDGDYDGIQLHLREGIMRNPDKSKGAASRVHSLDVYVHDENHENLIDTSQIRDYQESKKKIKNPVLDKII